MGADINPPPPPPATPGATAAPSPSAAAAASAKEWKVRRVGASTLAISKPKRKSNKIRQMRLKNRRRAR